MTVQLRHNRWQPREGEIAGRVEIDLLAGRWFKEIIVEPGQGALFSADGRHLPPQPSGSYLVKDLGDKLASLLGLRNVPRMTAVFYNTARFDAALRWEDAVSADSYQLAVSLRLGLQVADPATLRNTLLFSRDVLTTDDLIARVQPNLRDAVNRRLRALPFAELPRPHERPAQFLTLAQSAVEHDLNGCGLRIVDVVSALIDAPHLQDMTQAEADLRAQAEQLALSERRADLQRRMRDQIRQQKVDDLQSAQEFDRLLHELDRDRLLADAAWEQFVRELQAQRERETADAEQARRQHALIRDYLLQALEAALRHEAELQALLREADMTTRRQQLERQRLQHQQQLARMRAAFAREQEELEREEDEKDALQGLRLLDAMQRRRAPGQ